MHREWLGCLVAVMLGSLLAAGCASLSGARAPDGVCLFDSAGGATWRNHVKVVADPAGGSRPVLRGERVAKDSFQMTFVNTNGFFRIPEAPAGEVCLRVWVVGEGQVRVALVSGGKIKSYYRTPPTTGEWCQLVLPLVEVRGKLTAGDKINDITIWLKSKEKGAALPANSAIYLDRAVLIGTVKDGAAK